MKKQILAAAAVALAGGAAAQEGTSIQLSCGQLAGNTYWADEGAVPKSESGWDKETFTSHRSRFTFEMTSDGPINPVLEYRDSTQRWYNPAAAEDAFINISAARADIDEDLNLQLVVIYTAPNGVAATVESHIYPNVLGLASPPELIWTQSRVTEQFTSSKTLTGPCEMSFPGAN